MKAPPLGLVDGVTTNPFLVAREGGVDFKQHVAAICELVKGDVSAEVTIQILGNYDWKTEVLAASIRHSIHVIEAARIGADVVTMPFKVMDQLVNHPLTDSGLNQFLADWRKAA